MQSEETKIFIIGKENCNYCKRAKDLLTRVNLPFEYKDVTEIEIEDIPVGAKTFPVVFINDEWIGGFDQLSVHEVVLDSIR